MPVGRPWWRDPWFWTAVAVGVVLRALPMLVWGWDSNLCTRDECIYKIVARPILEGEGLGLAPKGWLPAPGFPYLLAACHSLFGAFETVKWVHVALLLPTAAFLHDLARRLDAPRAAPLVAWAVALHPTLVFFAGTLWTETVYTALLAGTVWGVAWARQGTAPRAIVPGFLLGATVLSRGVATYLAPLVVLALLAPPVLRASRSAWRDAFRERLRHGLAFALALALCVLPYSVQATARWGHPVISDATLGHVIALGNDDYPPVTFDFMNGQLTGRQYARTLRSGRRDCPHTGDPIDHDRCEVDRAVEWILEHPATFVARVPVRLAQLVNPHSFLTRHVRWHYWPGLPWALKEGLLGWQAIHSALVVLAGTFAVWLRARGPMGLLIVGTVAYHVGVIAALYGLTRFRLPLEPLWLVFLLAWAVEPSALREAWREERWRVWGGLVSVALLAPLVGWFAWTGWPGGLGP